MATRTPPPSRHTLPTPLLSAYVALFMRLPPANGNVRVEFGDGRWPRTLMGCMLPPENGSRIYTIKLHPSARQAPRMGVCVLAHEWAHVLEYDSEGRCSKEHGPAFLNHYQSVLHALENRT